MHNFKQTVIERVNRAPAYAKTLLNEATGLFLSGEPATARLILRDLVNVDKCQIISEVTAQILGRYCGSFKAIDNIKKTIANYEPKQTQNDEAKWYFQTKNFHPSKSIDAWIM
ncbi:MAG: hypothetical protein IPP97_05610 [Candidatus Obscuribacter sp.]|nr:hypothetical protein [Candidatus Obscuribacter sp.]MBP6594405.1 hypothetical protein [Candidatus Obscuribacter sp.]MBP7576347.1 hypothetical protein [Candidatus Obscuribacter sp.]